MNANEIVQALREECEDCSEFSPTDKKCHGILYCPTRYAASLIESQAAKIAELNDFQNSQCAILLAKLNEAERRERALIDFAVRAERDYMECDKMFIHVGRLRQDAGYNAYLIDAQQSGEKPLTFEQWLRGPQAAGKEVEA